MGHAGHASGAPLYVHPHGSLEVFFRMALGREIAGGRFSPSFAVSGQSVLEDIGGHAPGTRFLVAEAVPGFRLGRLSVNPRLEWPLTTQRRQEWAVGLGVGTRW
jgi:hypothetical protein